MATPHPYTTGSLGADDPRFLPRTPGVDEIERLFPSPVSADKGSMAIEGGVSVVAGPGMGKTSLLAQLAARLDRDRRLTTALVTVPDAGAYAGEDGFYAFLGELVLRIRGGLSASPRIGDAASAPVAAVLATEPAWEGHTPGIITPRGFERFVAPLAAAAVHTPGVCLLFDDVDSVGGASWKSAFVAALRFVFQASSGLTPVYALWTLFGDESLPGSNNFRNVTRPLFLEPLTSDPASPGGCKALASLGLPAVSDATMSGLLGLVGGHPQLLHKLLGDLCESISEAGVDPAALASADAARIDRLLGSARIEGQLAFARELVARTPGLAAALVQVRAGMPAGASLPKGLLASGLVGRDEAGQPFVPARVAAAL